MSRRLAAAALVVGLVLLVIAAMVGWALRDSLGANPDLSTTWNGLLGVLAGSFPVALGAVLGAAGALIVAVVNREEARRARFSANALSLATDVIVQADIHARELRQLVAWLLEYVEGSDDRGKTPELHSSEPVRRAYLALGLLDKALGTKGEAIYNALIAMDDQTRRFRLDPEPEYQGWDMAEYERLIAVYFAAMDAFRDEWRSRPS